MIAFEVLVIILVPLGAVFMVAASFTGIWGDEL